MNNIRKSLYVSNTLYNVSTKLLTINVCKYSSMKDGGQDHSNIKNTDQGTIKSEKTLSGLKNTFNMFEKVLQQQQEKSNDDVQVKEADTRSFATMVRESNLIGIGDPNGRIISGKIIEVVDEDLYIDFGGKFHCVCKKPKSRSGLEYIYINI